MAIDLIAQGRFSEPPLPGLPKSPCSLASAFTYYLCELSEVSSHHRLHSGSSSAFRLLQSVTSTPSRGS